MTIPQTPIKPFIVYGTLRPGHGNYLWALSGRTTSEEDITVRGARLVSNGGFPYLIFADGQDAVATLVHVAAEHYKDVLTDLDRLEGYTPGSKRNLYDRITVTVQNDAGESVEAWLYTPSQDSLPRVSALSPVPGNDWNNWVEEPFPRKYWVTV